MASARTAGAGGIVSAAGRGAFVYLRAMAGFVVVWHLAALAIDNRILMPTPPVVAEAFWKLLLELEIPEHAAISLARMIASLALAACIGVPLGVAMGLDRRLGELIDPLIELLRPISGIAWIPLGLFMFGIGNALPLFIMTYAAFFPIVIGAVAGVRRVDRRLIDAARTMGVGRATIVLRVVLPAATPALLLALRLAAASAWSAVVAAELVGAPSGLGYAIEWYREFLMTPKVMAFVAVIGVLGYLCDAGLRRAQSALTPWAPTRAVLG